MQPKQRLFALVAGLVIVLAAIWYFLRRAETHEAAPPAAAEEETPTVPVAEAPPPPPRPAPAAPSPAPQQEEEPVAEDGVPFMPAHDGDPVPDGYRHFHPITPKHKRLYRENGLIESLNGAMDVKDAAGLRKLLAQYKREYPEDEWELQGGYAVIADCFEHPGDATRAAAKSWVEAHNGSPLKRFVNRHCFE